MKLERIGLIVNPVAGKGPAYNLEVARYKPYALKKSWLVRENWGWLLPPTGLF